LGLAPWVRVSGSLMDAHLPLEVQQEAVPKPAKAA